MSPFAFVFPGQGSQSVSMGRELAMSSPAAGAVWSAADAALGEPLSRLAWEGPAEQLDRTENAQPALLAASIAILEAMRDRWASAGLEPPRPAFAHSPRTPPKTSASACWWRSTKRASVA